MLDREQLCDSLDQLSASSTDARETLQAGANSVRLLLLARADRPAQTFVLEVTDSYVRIIHLLAMPWWSRHKPTSRRTVRPSAALVALALLALTIGGAGVALGGSYSSRPMALVLWLVVVVLVYLGLVAFARSFGPLGEVVTGHCSGCGYALGGLPPGFGTEPIEDLAMGPRACPECGRRWPAVR